MKVLVVGATGRTGLRILNRLSDEPYQLTAMVRNIAKAKAILPPDIELRHQDLRDYSGLGQAVNDVDVVIFAAGSTAFSEYWAGNNRPQDIDYEAVRQLAMAADNHHVKKFILISSMGVHQPYHFLNLFGRVLHWKKKGEDALRSTHLNYTIIRPGQLTDSGYNPHQLRTAQDNKVHYKPVSRAEVAEVVRQCIAFPGSVRTTFELYRGKSAAPDAIAHQLEKLIGDEKRALHVLESAAG